MITTSTSPLSVGDKSGGGEGLVVVVVGDEFLGGEGEDASSC